MPFVHALLIAGLGATPAVAQGPGLPGAAPVSGDGAPAATDTAFDDAAAARDAVAQGHKLIAVPSGKTVWLDEIRTDRMPGIGPMQRLRFVMPSLAALVPELPPEGTAHDPAEYALTPDDEAALNDGSLAGAPAAEGDDVPLTAGAVAADDGSGIEIAPADGIHGTLQGGADPAPGDNGMIPDSAFSGAVAAPPPGTEADADMAVAVPAAPDLLMQDPNHNDAVWLCEHIALPQLAGQHPRPAQVVISLASAPTPFGSFDPSVVQLFEAFSIPADRDACLWEPW